MVNSRRTYTMMKISAMKAVRCFTQCDDGPVPPAISPVDVHVLQTRLLVPVLDGAVPAARRNLALLERVPLAPDGHLVLGRHEAVVRGLVEAGARRHRALAHRRSERFLKFFV